MSRVRVLRRHTGRSIAAGALVVALAVTAVMTTGGGTAGATTPIAQATGRLLSGEGGGTNFDTVASFDGETASYPGNPGPNSNDLQGSLAGGALKLPGSKAVGVPGLGAVEAGLLSQYAKANADGSAVASSGALGSNGALNVGGAGDSAFGTVDLSGLPGASAITDVVGNLKLTIGALSARAKQAAFGEKLADPAAGCNGGATYHRVGSSSQGGRYVIAGLDVTATSKLLSTLGESVSSLLTDLLATLEPLQASGLVTGLPSADDIDNDLSISLADGGVTASLTDGSLHISLAKILESVGLDINNLCPNTDLLPYLAKALSKLPSAISQLLQDTVDKLTTSFANVKLAGQFSLGSFKDVYQPLVNELTDQLTSGSTSFERVLEPMIDLFTSSLFDAVVNHQQRSGNTFSVTALQLAIAPNGASLPSLPGLPSLPTTLPAPTTAAAKKAERSAAADTGHGFVGALAAPRLSPLSAPIAAPHLTTASTPALEIDLASAQVQNSAPSGTDATSAGPSSGVAAESTSLPTGVPAGNATSGHGTPTTPLVLVALGVLLAGAGLFTMRRRGRFGR